MWPGRADEAWPLQKHWDALTLWVPSAQQAQQNSVCIVSKLSLPGRRLDEAHESRHLLVCSA